MPTPKLRLCSQADHIDHPRYAFDVVGELYLGEMFGFLEKNHDHGGWIHSLDLLMPFLCLCAVAPASARPLILASSLFVPGSFKALKAVENIGISARSYVARRFDEGARLGSRKRTDMLQQLYDVHLDKGDKVDFHMGDIEQEAYVGMSCSDPPGPHHKVMPRER